MAVLDSWPLPSISNDADGDTGGRFEDITLRSLGKANTIRKKNISQKITMSELIVGLGTKKIRVY